MSGTILVKSPVIPQWWNITVTAPSVTNMPSGFYDWTETITANWGATIWPWWNFWDSNSLSFSQSSVYWPITIHYNLVWNMVIIKHIANPSWSQPFWISPDANSMSRIATALWFTSVVSHITRLCDPNWWSNMLTLMWNWSTRSFWSSAPVNLSWPYALSALLVS